MKTSHLEEYLEYYKGCKKPGYAVLVTGEWGVGKTYQVLNALKEHERYYVSLFGLQSADDVYSEVFAGMDPEAAGARKVFGHIENVMGRAGGLAALAGLIPSAVKAAMRHEVKIDRILIFDDLERSGLKLKEMLGIINRYVEHHECQVVVITHDDKLGKYFLQTKEKIFGQTIKIEPQIDAALDHFCSMAGDQARTFIRQYRSIITDTFYSSGVGSLRILKQLIHDIDRLHRCLDEEHIVDEVAMAELVSLFSALDLEIRSHNLSEDDLRNRRATYYGYKVSNSGKNENEEPEPLIVIAEEKYDSIDLTNELLKDQALVSMFIFGIYDQEIVRNSLNDSHYFLPPEDIPPWKIVLQFHRIDDDVLEQARNDMQRQFDEREVTIPGELLHIFSLRLMMTDEQILRSSIEETVADCKSYIDDLLKVGRLAPLETGTMFDDSWDMGYDGFGYWDSNRKEFKEILHYLIESRRQALEARLPAVAQTLLSYLNDDAQAFVQAISYTRSEHNPYARIPVLKQIEPEEFVGVWMDSPKENRRVVMTALKERYSGNRLEHELSAEAEWAQKVGRLLVKEADKSQGFNRVSIRRSIPGIILPEG